MINENEPPAPYRPRFNKKSGIVSEIDGFCGAKMTSVLQIYFFSLRLPSKLANSSGRFVKCNSNDRNVIFKQMQAFTCTMNRVVWFSFHFYLKNTLPSCYCWVFLLIFHLCLVNFPLKNVPRKSLLNFSDFWKKNHTQF